MFLFYFYVVLKMLSTMIISANIALNFFLDIVYAYIKTFRLVNILKHIELTNSRSAV